jgi:hypothetical protein
MHNVKSSRKTPPNLGFFYIGLIYINLNFFKNQNNIVLRKKNQLFLSTYKLISKFEKNKKFCLVINWSAKLKGINFPELGGGVAGRLVLAIPV